MTKVEAITAELKKRIEAANFKEIVITMKCNGDKIVITPCNYGYDEKPRWEDIEYYLVEAGMVNLCGNESLEKVAETISRYEDLLNESNEDIERLKEYIRKHGEFEIDWGWVSDWHKDLFGHRPHVSATQMFAWANSKYKGSARMFRMSK